MYEKNDVRSHYLVEVLHRLREAEHDVCFAENTIMGLGMNAERIIRHVAKIEADAWIVLSAPYEVLKWFDQQSIPTFSLYGSPMDLPIACIGPQKLDAMRELVDHLVGFGHKRIALINREERRKPKVGYFEKEYLKQL